jgi:hypothetical protein
MPHPPTPSHPHSIAAAQTKAAARGNANQLTILVFKDNHAARVFRVPLRWVLQFGWLLGALLTTVVVGLAASTYLFHLSRRAVPDASSLAPAISLTQTPVAPQVVPVPPATSPASTEHVTQLELQVKSLEDQLAAFRAANPALAEEAHPAPIVSPDADIAAGTPLTTQPFLFRGLPEQIQAPPAQIPITLTTPSAHWEGKTLKVHFGVQYTAMGGSQQGRIIILARGPGIVLSHPAQLFQPTGHDSLINPNQGEYFSVSRFRDTRAEFGPIANRDSIHEVEVIILSQSGQLFIHQMIQPSQAAATRVRTKSQKSEKVKDDTSDDASLPLDAAKPAAAALPAGVTPAATMPAAAPPAATQKGNNE